MFGDCVVDVVDVVDGNSRVGNNWRLLSSFAVQARGNQLIDIPSKISPANREYRSYINKCNHFLVSLTAFPAAVSSGKTG